MRKLALTRDAAHFWLPILVWVSLSMILPPPLINQVLLLLLIHVFGIFHVSLNIWFEEVWLSDTCEFESSEEAKQHLRVSPGEAWRTRKFLVSEGQTLRGNSCPFLQISAAGIHSDSRKLKGD